MWDQCISMWDQSISMWDQCISMWDHCLSMWDHCLSMWDHCISMWYDCISMLDHCISMWDCFISLHSGSFWHGIGTFAFLHQYLRQNKGNHMKLSGYDPWGLPRSPMSSRITLSSKIKISTQNFQGIFLGAKYDHP